MPEAPLAQNEKPQSPKMALAGEDANPRRLAPELVWDGERNVSIKVSEDYQLRTLYGTRTGEAAAALLTSAIKALGENARDYVDLMVAMPVEMEPRDAAEAMLVTQMAATHVAMTQMSLRLHGATSYQLRESFERSMTRLSRTCLAQMDQLKRYRAKAQQVVRVERVTVNDGGQAIVGDVSYGRGEDAEI
jgi:hypothetical protein